MNEKLFNLFALCFSLGVMLFIIAKGEAKTEDAIIRKAAERNGCRGDNYLILLAIRKAENGKPGCELGVKGKAWNTNLDTQAGWCAASIVKSRARWIAAGKPGDFIDFFGARYCPPSAHILNKNWVGNVKYWFGKYKEQL